MAFERSRRSRRAFAKGRWIVDTSDVLRSPRFSTLLALALGWSTLACQREEPKEDAKGGVGAELSSPNARILPAPLVSARTSGGELPADASAATPARPAAPPRPFSVDGELPAEVPPARDGWVLELRGEFLWPDLDARTVQVPAHEVSWGRKGSSGLTALPTRPELRLFVSPQGSLTVEIASPTMALPVGTQLRSRSDRWGHVVVWPDRRSYRVAPRGSLRAIFNERRVDVSPLVDGRVETGEAGRRFGLPTQRRSIEGPLGKVTLESARVTGLGDGGLLVCRLLLELGRIESSGEACLVEELPVEAQYVWARGGELVFRVTAVQRHASLAALDAPDLFDIPPPMPILKPGELPPEETPLLWSTSALVQLWGASDGSTADLVLSNPNDLPMYVLVDRLPLARVPPLGKTRWTTQRRPRSIGFRDFLGEHVFPARTVEPPAELVLSAPSPVEPTAEAAALGTQR